MLPTKIEDPRVLGRQTIFANNSKEVLVCATMRRNEKRYSHVIQRAEFNSCGESSTSSTTYTGVPARRFSELPRMGADSKASILGAAASGAVKGTRAQRDIDEKGHPFSFAEVKPLNLRRRIGEHHNITHVVDFTPGSAALATTAAGAFEYEGVAATNEHALRVA